MTFAAAAVPPAAGLALEDELCELFEHPAAMSRAQANVAMRFILRCELSADKGKALRFPAGGCRHLIAILKCGAPHPRRTRIESPGRGIGRPSHAARSAGPPSYRKKATLSAASRGKPRPVPHSERSRHRHSRSAQPQDERSSGHRLSTGGRTPRFGLIHSWSPAACAPCGEGRTASGPRLGSAVRRMPRSRRAPAVARGPTDRA